MSMLYHISARRLCAYGKTYRNSTARLYKLKKFRDRKSFDGAFFFYYRENVRLYPQNCDIGFTVCVCVQNKIPRAATQNMQLGWQPVPERLDKTIDTCSSR